MLVSIFLAVFGNWVAPVVFRLLGAEGELLDLAMQYMTPILWGTIFFILLSVCNSILIAEGDSRTLSSVMIVGFFLNLVLDPWFLYGGYGLPAMGIFGIALATVVIQCLGSSYILSVVIRRGLLKDTKPEDFVPDWKMYSDIIVQAIPASFNTMSVAFGFFIVNFFSEGVWGRSDRCVRSRDTDRANRVDAIIRPVCRNPGVGRSKQWSPTFRPRVADCPFQ